MPDPILLWNEVALEANRVSHTNGQGEQAGPPLSARALAIVHLAMYDAFAGVVNDPMTLPRYLAAPASPGAGSSDAAVAAAAHHSLAFLYPSQKPVFDSILAVAGDPTDPAHAFGVAVAIAILDDRNDDPGVGSANYRPSALRGRHRPDPDNISQGFHGPDYGRLSKGFGISQRFELAPPPFDDGEYLAALGQVRGKGIKPDLMGTLPNTISGRAAHETLIGLFWGYDGAAQLGTPPRLYNQIIRRVAQQQGNSVTDNARLFAFVNVALADAGILAWDQKYIHDFWRPVVGIREHDPSLGPGSALPGHDVSDDCDPLWLPLGAPLTNRIGKNFTPHFPAYPSGHATFGAAAFHITRLFYGDGGKFADGNLSADSLFDGLNFVSEEFNAINTDNTGMVRPRHVRNFPGGLLQMIEENGRSRVFLGVHWVFDAFVVTGNGEPDLLRRDGAGNAFGGVPLGLQIAEDIFSFGNQLAPKRSTVGPRTQSVAAPAGRTQTFSSSFLR